MPPSSRDSGLVESADRYVINLHAFARLYGVLRWFHPSDAAAAVDWNRFAIEGTRRVINAPDQGALRRTLDDLRSSFAPTVHIVRTDEAFPYDPATAPPSAQGLEVVAWEHMGFGDSTITSVYASKRRHRSRAVAVYGSLYAALWQAVDATAYRGQEIRLRGKLRTARHGLGRIWVRVERGDQRGFFDNMVDRPIESAQWTTGEVTGTVAADATRIVFGAVRGGPGTTWYDDLQLEARAPGAAWRAVEIDDPGFESADLSAGWRPGSGTPRFTSNDGWQVTRDTTVAASGTASLRIEQITKPVTEELFTDAPSPGEVTDFELGDGLRARVPLTLYSRDGHTIGDDPVAAARTFGDSTSASGIAAFDLNAGIADIIVVWNVLEHFWPYWDVVPDHWLGELDLALQDARDDRSIEDHVKTLRRLVAAAPDGHAKIRCRGEPRTGYLPFLMDAIDDQVVVTATDIPAVSVGDLVLAVDGRPALDELRASEPAISGSPQWKRVGAIEQLGSGMPGSRVKLRLRHAGQDREIELVRGDKLSAPPRRPAITTYPDGVYYVDLSRVDMSALDAEMAKLAAAPGIVFDMRNPPLENQAVLSHLLSQVDTGKNFAVPHIIRPDHTARSTPSWDLEGWNLPVLQPHIAGRVAFLTNASSISFPESILSLVSHYHLGAIVGSATAGSNGNIAAVDTPAGCQVIFTGLRTTMLDGSRFHLVGIQSTIALSPTIAGIAAGRDELLERALAYVRAAN